MPRSSFKLLVVDDDEGDRKQILRLVERSGLPCETVVAATMDEALKTLENEQIQCVILDYYMPDQDGLAGIAVLLQREPLLPVIMSTGQGSERIAKEAIKAGAMDYLCKADLNVGILRAALENVLERAELNRKFAEKQAALSVFAKVLVHDMKTPTQSILGFARLVETFLRREDFDREKIIQQAQRIAEGALRMNALLDNLRDYTEADAQPDFENIQLEQLVSDVLANLDATLNETGARVFYGDLPVVCADRTQLLLLMQNLIGNGIKYCRGRIPEIHVRAKKQHDGRCIIEIQDNGIGIPEQHYKNVFEPFRRLHSRGEYDGSGLGLATCKKIVERHNGAIWCKSKLGEGTSFYFTLPAIEASERADAGRSRSGKGVAA
jgi:signal transduction histidine kinase